MPYVCEVIPEYLAKPHGFPISVGYTITFCEGDNTGLPYGISPLHDGR